MTKFVIISTQRSGSTFFRTCLNSHPDVRCIGEAFLPHYRKPLSYSNFINESPKRKIANVFFRKQVVNQYLDYLFSQQGFQAIGFKFMYSQARKIPRTYPMVMDYIRRNEVKVIHMVRENTLKMIISRYRNKITKTPHIREKIPMLTIRLPTNNLIKEIQYIEKEKAQWRKKLSQFPYLEISYESFIRDSKREACKVLNFINVKEDHDLTSPLVKINPDDLRKFLENYDEVEDTLSGTPYETFIRP